MYRKYVIDVYILFSYNKNMKLIFIVGPHAVGKTTLAKEIEGKLGFPYIDAGQTMRGLKQKYAPNISMEEWMKYLESKYGTDISNLMLARVMKKQLEGCKPKCYIIVGFRQLSGIKSIINHLNIKDSNILFIDASLELLKSNYDLRLNTDDSRKDRKLDKNEFVEYINAEKSRGLEEIRNFVKRHSDKSLYVYKQNNEDNVFEKVTSTFFKSEMEK